MAYKNKIRLSITILIIIFSLGISLGIYVTKLIFDDTQVEELELISDKIIACNIIQGFILGGSDVIIDGDKYMLIDVQNHTDSFIHSTSNKLILTNSYNIFYMQKAN